MENLLQNYIGKKLYFRMLDGNYFLNALTVVEIVGNAVHCVKDNGVGIILNIDYITFFEEVKEKAKKDR